MRITLYINADYAEGTTTGTRTLGQWSPEEGAKLKNVIAVTYCKKSRHGGKERYGIDWAAVAALVPARSARQCNAKWANRWNDSLEVPAPLST